MHGVFVLSDSVAQHHLTFLFTFDPVKQVSLLANKARSGASETALLFPELPGLPEEVFTVSWCQLVGDTGWDFVLY